MSRLNLDGTIRIDRAVGSHGTVYLSIPGAKSGAGKVHINQLNRTVEYKAVTSQEPLPTGAKIVVVRIVNADTVEVAPAPESNPKGQPMLEFFSQHVEIAIMVVAAAAVFFMVS